MNRYIDWVQVVLRAVLVESTVYHTLTIHDMPSRLGIEFDNEEQQREAVISIDHALRDLAVADVIDYSMNNGVIKYPPESRRFRVENLTSTWPALRKGYIDADEDAYLRALAKLSEKPSEAYVSTEEVEAEDVFRSLGWDWDTHRAVAIYNHLRDVKFVDGQMYMGPTIHVRVTYAGLVRVEDESGALLREAEDHLVAGRLRAAGCVAAVELERRLKLLTVGVTLTVSKRRDPSLDDYNQGAYDNDLIDQAAWRSIQSLAAIRKKCVHVLDSEPTTDEVERLIEGVEVILRQYPPPATT